ncbi:exo-beta-N-acetylmuramidase NamZ family protein [Thermodesulfatator indicus]
MVKSGLERLLKESRKDLLDRRLGLLCHQASILPDLTPAWVALKAKFSQKLKLLFSPQHGLFGEKQANMIASYEIVEPETGVPVISLYGPRLAPEPEHLAEIDILLVDLQDVGTRVYTYIWTLLLTMKACSKNGVKLIVLDRPNPIGGKIEGPILEEKFFSFVGLAPIPMRHGLTIGELALYFCQKFSLDLELEVIPMEGWSRDMFFPETGLPWISPSPNMPRFETSLVYPGQVILEGTNLSEGRGTTMPFEVFGAPWLKVLALKEFFSKIEGIKVQIMHFIPWFDKWAGKLCQGIRLWIKEPQTYQPVKTTLLMLKEVAAQNPEFTFRSPPYEYEWSKSPFDIIVGKEELREALITQNEEHILTLLEEGTKEFQEEVEGLKLYV